MTDNKDIDWEYMDDFYNGENEREVRSFEEILKESRAEMDEEDSYGFEDDDESKLKKTVEDVKNVRNMSANGMTIPEIARELNLDEKYVYIILVTLTSSTDDDNDIAIAHLVMME